MRNKLALVLAPALAATALADGSTIDPWDVSQGTVVTSSSGTNGVSSASDLLGATLSGVEPGATIFRDDQPAGFVHFVEWRTTAPITVDGFSIRANDDTNPDAHRSVSEFRIYARNTGTGEFDLLKTLVPSDNPYPRGFLVFSAAVTPVVAQDFRAEFVQFAGSGVGGPRIEEIDGPLPLRSVDGFIAPTKVKAKRNAASPAKSKLKAAGFLDTGALAPGFGTSATLDVGGLTAFSQDGLAQSGKSLRMEQNGLVLQVAPSKVGSSRAKFKVTFTGDLTGLVDLEEDLPFRFLNAAADATGEVDLDGGNFSFASDFNDVEEPAFHVLSAKAKLGPNEGDDALSLFLFRALRDSNPTEPPDVRLEFGTFAVTLPSTAFRRSGFSFVLKAPVGGITSCQLTGETVKIAGKGLDLGAFAEGGNPVRIRCVVGADPREVTIRMGRKGKSLKY